VLEVSVRVRVSLGASCCCLAAILAEVYALSSVAHFELVFSNITVGNLSNWIK